MAWSPLLSQVCFHSQLHRTLASPYCVKDQALLANLPAGTRHHHVYVARACHFCPLWGGELTWPHGGCRGDSGPRRLQHRDHRVLVGARLLARLPVAQRVRRHAGRHSAEAQHGESPLTRVPTLVQVPGCMYYSAKGSSKISRKALQAPLVF